MAIDPADPNIPITVVLDYYERLSKVMHDNLDLIRKILAQSNVRDFLNAMGVATLYDKLKTMSPQAMQQVSVLLGKVSEDDR